MTPGPALDRLVNEIMYGESPGAVYPFSTSPIFLHQLMKWACERYYVAMNWNRTVKEWFAELNPEYGVFGKHCGRHEQPYVALCLAIVSTKETTHIDR